MVLTKINNMVLTKIVILTKITILIKMLGKSWSSTNDLFGCSIMQPI